jgi:hypothetical protein
MEATSVSRAPAAECGVCDAIIDVSVSADAGLCQGCFQVRYCDRVCQRADWDSGHKQTCKKARKEREVAGEVASGGSVTTTLQVPAAATSPAKSCSFCGHANGKLMLCSRCKNARYCHADHQRQHWCVRISINLQCL